jgi:hypothetical protein
MERGNGSHPVRTHCSSEGDSSSSSYAAKGAHAGENQAQARRRKAVAAHCALPDPLTPLQNQPWGVNDTRGRIVLPI